MAAQRDRTGRTSQSVAYLGGAGMLRSDGGVERCAMCTVADVRVGSLQQSHFEGNAIAKYLERPRGSTIRHNTQRAACNTQHATRNVTCADPLHEACNMQHATCDYAMQHATYNKLNTAYDMP